MRKFIKRHEGPPLWKFCPPFSDLRHVTIKEAIYYLFVLQQSPSRQHPYALPPPSQISGELPGNQRPLPLYARSFHSSSLPPPSFLPQKINIAVVEMETPPQRRGRCTRLTRIDTVKAYLVANNIDTITTSYCYDDNDPVDIELAVQTFLNTIIHRLTSPTSSRSPQPLSAPTLSSSLIPPRSSAKPCSRSSMAQRVKVVHFDEPRRKHRSQTPDLSPSEKQARERRDKDKTVVRQPRWVDGEDDEVKSGPSSQPQQPRLTGCTTDEYILHYIPATASRVTRRIFPCKNLGVPGHGEYGRDLSLLWPGSPTKVTWCGAISGLWDVVFDCVWKGPWDQPDFVVFDAYASFSEIQRLQRHREVWWEEEVYTVVDLAFKLAALRQSNARLKGALRSSTRRGILLYSYLIKNLLKNAIAGLDKYSTGESRSERTCAVFEALSFKGKGKDPSDADGETTSTTRIIHSALISFENYVGMTNIIIESLLADTRLAYDGAKRLKTSCLRRQARAEAKMRWRDEEAIVVDDTLPPSSAFHLVYSGKLNAIIDALGTIVDDVEAFLAAGRRNLGGLETMHIPLKRALEEDMPVDEMDIVVKAHYIHGLNIANGQAWAIARMYIGYYGVMRALIAEERRQMLDRVT
ncbi:hypothetical protein B0H63DRAFT_546335 [Podospora didyma]|uniref:Uncharacterized protein n=1 Tax=Podospora didyma TaxID=330526 RepID=A0AAE0TW82_9PEZI|nr:hypothetical protein B0H63DRAFT_546335 [Podospora didyma]